MTPFELGFVVGLLIGEGHFGGDGRQPQITLRMHTRHKPMLDRLVLWVPGSKVYGPYLHGGRDYCQWMVRHEPLRELLRAIVDSPIPIEELNPHVAERMKQMLSTYSVQLRGPQ